MSPRTSVDHNANEVDFWRREPEKDAILLCIGEGLRVLAPPQETLEARESLLLGRGPHAGALVEAIDRASLR